MRVKGEQGLLLALCQTLRVQCHQLFGLPRMGEEIPHQGWMWELVPVYAEQLKQCR